MSFPAGQISRVLNQLKRAPLPFPNIGTVFDYSGMGKCRFLAGQNSKVLDLLKSCAWVVSKNARQCALAGQLPRRSSMWVSRQNYGSNWG